MIYIESTKYKGFRRREQIALVGVISTKRNLLFFNTHKHTTIMKKWKFYAAMLAVLPMMAFIFSSCTDEDDLPDVNISLEVEQGVVSDGVIYVVQSEPIEIAGIKVVNNDANKDAAVTNVNYYWDGYFYAPSVFYPFGMTFQTSENTTLGNHSIDVTCTVLAVDKSVSTATLSFPVKVVASAEDLPAVEGGSRTLVRTATMK